MSLNPNAPECPHDGHALEADSTPQHWHCPQCAAQFRLQGHCNTCGNELERLAACGAVNWFCNHCNSLKSKSVVEYKLAAR